MRIKLKFSGLCILLIFLINCLSGSAHPHPVVYIEGKDHEITIHALHWQKIDLAYLKKNFILENCDYNIYLQDPFTRQNLETKIYIYHNCSNLKIKKNTLFRDYWNGIPLFIQVEGFDDSKEKNISQKEITKNLQSSKTQQNSFIPLNFNFPQNPILLVLMLFIIGGLFSVVGDFFNLLVPISLTSKTKENKYLWLKSGILHIISTYIVLLLSINFIINHIFKYTGLLVISVGFLMLAENYMSRKNISPLLVALVPCSGALFVSSILFKEHAVLAYFSPLIMGVGELSILKAGSVIPYPKKYIKFIPLIIIISGIFLIIKFF